MPGFEVSSSWEKAALDYLNAVIADPSTFDQPSWSKLQQVSGRSKATLWRREQVYERYLSARAAWTSHRSRAARHEGGYRRTLEDRVLHLEEQLEQANRIVEAHLRKYQEICRALQDMRLDPVAILGEMRVGEVNDGDEHRSP